jgi:hypothetical protein
MAYMSQERKAQLAPAIKAACKKYGIKATIAVRNHMTLCVNIKSGRLDLIGNHVRVIDQPDGWAAQKQAIDVNPYHYRNHFDGDAKEFLIELFTAMNQGNHDRSDIQSDYFDVGWYVDVNIGSWNKPYTVEA